MHRTKAENLSRNPELKWQVLGELYAMPDKERYPLPQWSETVSYILRCQVRFNSYEDISKSLKPFSLKVR